MPHLIFSADDVDSYDLLRKDNDNLDQLEEGDFPLQFYKGCSVNPVKWDMSLTYLMSLMNIFCLWEHQLNSYAALWEHSRSSWPAPLPTPSNMKNTFPAL